MLWNWYTIDSCFFSTSWHITSHGMFAGSCIGVILLVMVLELLRRGQREFDRYLHRVNATSCTVVSDAGSGSIKGLNTAVSGGRDRLKLWQHVVRSFFFMVQFAVGYIVMLLAMYYNGQCGPFSVYSALLTVDVRSAGYFIICIFIGAFLGALAFQWDTYSTGNGYVSFRLVSFAGKFTTLPFALLSEGPETRDGCCS